MFKLPPAMKSATPVHVLLASTFVIQHLKAAIVSFNLQMSAVSSF